MLLIFYIIAVYMLERIGNFSPDEHYVPAYVQPDHKERHCCKCTVYSIKSADEQLRLQIKELDGCKCKSGKECSLDRINSDGDYEPSNCQWVSMAEQAWNKQITVWLNYRGKKITYCEAEKIGGIAASTIRGRLERGWSTERAIEQPARKFKCGNVSRVF